MSIYININIYIQLPAANPPPCPDKVIGCWMFVWNFSMFLSFCFVVLGVVFTRSLFNLRVISVSFWNHFGIILASLGVIWRPGAPQGTPPGSWVEKVTKKLVRGSFVGPPRWPLLEPKSVTNRKQIVANTTLKNIVRKVLQKRAPGTPSNHENDGFAKTKPLF